MPIAYFISAGPMKSKDMISILGDAIENLTEAGLKIKALVCDQGTNNQSTFKKLGISVDPPFFFQKKMTLHVIFDPLHLVKNIRNNFLKNNYLFENKLVDFQDIIKTYEIDKRSSTGRTLLKLTPAHLNPDAFHKMKCSISKNEMQLCYTNI